MALAADMDTWGPHKSQQTGSRQGSSTPQQPPQKKARHGDGDATSTTAVLVPASRAQSGGSSRSQPSQSSGSSSGSAALIAAYKQRAEDAEEQLVYVQSIMTKVVEQLTKSAASCKTASRFARTAADAFDTEYHQIQDSIDKIQAMYSAPTVSAAAALTF